MSRYKDEKNAIASLLALAQPTRIAVFRRLIRSYPDEHAAGEIARLCKTPHNTMSTHLAILVRAGLLSVRRDGRMMRYVADIQGFQTLMAFMLKDCCQGRTEICAPLIAELQCCMPTGSRKSVHA